MATVVITFAKGASCSAGNHYVITLLRDGSPVGTVPVSLPSMRADPPTNDDVREALIVLLHEMAERSGATTKANAKTVLDSATITLDYPVF